MFQTAEEESFKLAYADLDHIVDNLCTLAESHQEVTQKSFNSALNVVRDKISNNSFTIKASSEDLLGMADELNVIVGNFKI